MAHFIGSAQTEWIVEARTARLLAHLTYFDSKDREWPARRGTYIDGCAVPRFFWSRLGSPFTSAHRRATIVHDAACMEKEVTWREAHRMFYEACRYENLDRVEAPLMYALAYRFGPRWGDDVRLKTMQIIDADKARDALEEAIVYFRMRTCETHEEIEAAAMSLFTDIT